jgi:hypothetical protein
MMGLSWVPTGLGKGAKRTRGMVVLINPTSSARTVARGVTGHVNGVEAHKKRKSVTDEALCIILWTKLLFRIYAPEALFC